MSLMKHTKAAKLTEIAKMRSCWPCGSSDIIGAREPRKKDYGYHYPVPSLLSRVATAGEKIIVAMSGAIRRQFSKQENRDEAIAVFGVCVVLAFALLAFVSAVPGAIKEAQNLSHQVVSESRGLER